MSPPPISKTERREQIMQAALACFARKGYHLTTMDDIVAESGLSKGTLYWHYKNKKELFLSIAEWYFSQMLVAFSADDLQTGNAVENTRQLLDGFLQMITSEEQFFSVLIDFYAETRQDEDIQQQLQTMFNDFVDLFAPILQNGVDSGEFKPINTRNLVLTLMACYDGLFLYRFMLGENFNWIEIGQQLGQIIVDGLKA